MPITEKILQNLMSGLQDKNIKFRDLQKLLDALGFEGAGERRSSYIYL